MPKAWLLSEILMLEKGGAKISWDDDQLKTLALRFGVSREALLRRLLTLGKDHPSFLRE